MVLLSVLRSPSPLRKGALNRLIFFSLMIFQSPLTHSAGGSPISPLQVVAKFFKQQQQLAKSPDQLPVYLTAVCRAMLFPGNLVRSVDWSSAVSLDSLAAIGNDLNATGVWEEAFDLATKQTGWWKSIKSPEVLLAGSWSLLFGAVVTIVSGRSTPHGPRTPDWQAGPQADLLLTAPSLLTRLRLALDSALPRPHGCGHARLRHVHQRPDAHRYTNTINPNPNPNPTPCTSTP